MPFLPLYEWASEHAQSNSQRLQQEVISRGCDAGFHTSTDSYKASGTTAVLTY